MLRKVSEAVSEGNGPVHQEEFGFGQPAPVDEIKSPFKLTRSHFDKHKKMLDKFHDDLKDGMKRLFEQFSARQEQDARQRRHAMEEDETANTKTREHTESAAKAIRAVRGDSCTTERRVQHGPKTLISFGMMAEPPNLP